MHPNDPIKFGPPNTKRYVMSAEEKRTHWHPHVRSGNPLKDVQHGVKLPEGYYVYVHRGRVDSQAFYVGKGCMGRAWSFQGRTKDWQNHVAQNGLSVDVWYYGLTEDEAFEWERTAIQYYEAIGVLLVNFQHGPDRAVKRKFL